MSTRGKRVVYGIAEIAQAIGANRHTVAKWNERGKLPDPDDRLASGPVWLARTIEPWIRESRV